VPGYWILKTEPSTYSFDDLVKMNIYALSPEAGIALTYGD